MKVLTRDVIVESFQQSWWLVEVGYANFILALEFRNPTHACRITIIIRNHDRWVEGLKVQNNERPLIERG